MVSLGFTWFAEITATNGVVLVVASGEHRRPLVRRLAHETNSGGGIVAVEAEHGGMKGNDVRCIELKCEHPELADGNLAVVVGLLLPPI